MGDNGRLRYVMVIDLKKCIGCQTCTIACKATNGTPPRIFFTKTLEHEVGKFPRSKRHFVPVLCNHCDDAPCAKVCPSGATQKGEEGIVTVDNTKCVGCGACYVACPYNNRSYIERGSLKRGYYEDGLTPFERLKYRNFKEGTYVKCNFCKERLQEGKEPACVAFCPTGARVFGDLNNADSEVSKMITQRNAFQLHPDLGTKPSVYYCN